MTATRRAEVSEAFRAVSAQAEALCGSASAEQLCRRPAAESWSAAECLAHLAIGANLHTPAWREAYAAAKKRGTSGTEPYRMDVFGWLLNWSLKPGRFKYPTPARFEPVDCRSHGAGFYRRGCGHAARSHDQRVARELENTL